jgi:hypothetical protein
MSDGYSDAVSHYNWRFNNFLTQVIDYYQQPIDGCADLAGALLEFKKSNPGLFLKNEHDVPTAIINRFIFKLDIPIETNLIELLFIMQYTCKYHKSVLLLPHTKYKDKMIIFIDEDWRVMPHGVYCQIPNFQMMDGVQDVMLGYAKKRCHNDVPFGRPTLLVAEKHRYRRKAIILKDVIRM